MFSDGGVKDRSSRLPVIMLQTSHEALCRHAARVVSTAAAACGSGLTHAHRRPSRGMTKRYSKWSSLAAAGGAPRVGQPGWACEPALYSPWRDSGVALWRMPREGQLSRPCLESGSRASPRLTPKRKTRAGEGDDGEGYSNMLQGFGNSVLIFGQLLITTGILEFGEAGITPPSSLLASSLLLGVCFLLPGTKVRRYARSLLPSVLAGGVRFLKWIVTPQVRFAVPGLGLRCRI